MFYIFHIRYFISLFLARIFFIYTRFQNEPLNAIVVEKYDSVTHAALPGCTFQLRFLGGTSGTGGTVIGQKVTGQNGTCIWTGLTAGTYVVEEIDSADGYSKAMRSVDNFRGDCDIRVWLCQIAKNCYYSYLKKAGRVDSIEDIDILNVSAQDETVEERLARQDEAMQIQKILHDIPDP